MKYYLCGNYLVKFISKYQIRYYNLYNDSGPHLIDYTLYVTDIPVPDTLWTLKGYDE